MYTLTHMHTYTHMHADEVIDNFDEIDDTDGLDEEAERDAWKLRELRRIKRDREEMSELAREQEEVERRRGMTDAERIADDKAAGIDRFHREKGQQKFMQKYFHRGAFFQDDDVLKGRDYTASTLEDQYNKQAMPEIMQVKNFGLAGRTKWTHLVKEDTSSVRALCNRCVITNVSLFCFVLEIARHSVESAVRGEPEVRTEIGWYARRHGPAVGQTAEGMSRFTDDKEACYVYSVKWLSYSEGGGGGKGYSRGGRGHAPVASCFELHCDLGVADICGDERMRCCCCCLWWHLVLRGDRYILCFSGTSDPYEGGNTHDIPKNRFRISSVLM